MTHSRIMFKVEKVEGMGGSQTAADQGYYCYVNSSRNSGKSEDSLTDCFSVVRRLTILRILWITKGCY